jgi:hypothetical protein
VSGLSNYLLEKLQSKTGLSTAVVVGYALQALFGIASAILFMVALFFVFSNYFGFGPDVNFRLPIGAALSLNEVIHIHVIEARHPSFQCPER